MDTLSQFIFNGATEFTPESLVYYMVFVLILSCISSMVESVFILRGGY